MSSRPGSVRTGSFNRLAFLRGAAGVAVALPFLESLPERSAWTADAKPVFGFFIYGVEGGTWTYTSAGPLTFVRAPITVASVQGDVAVLSEGPDPGIPGSVS